MNESVLEGLLYEAPGEPQTFEQWLATARPGSRFVYHTGFVLDDKLISKETEEEKQKAAEIARVGQLAKEAFKLGKIELCQELRRDDAGKRDGFDYIAVKRREVVPPTVHGIPWRMRVNDLPAEGYKSRDWTKG